MSRAKFDELIHAPTRLSIVSLLAAAEWAGFKFIRDELGLSDSALSKQLTSLEAVQPHHLREELAAEVGVQVSSLSGGRTRSCMLDGAHASSADRSSRVTGRATRC